MAAGIGSRYGGLKQVDPVGPNDEIIIDYSVFDARRAGFGKVVFIIRRDIEAIFRERVGRRIERQVDVAYVFQEATELPAGFDLPAGRTKPWGTGHAVLCCREAVAGPLAVINADDFYGAGAFQSLAAFLRQTPATPNDYALVGYVLANTLSEHGHVARGVCQVGEDGYLIDLNERLRIERRPEGVAYTENGSDWVPLAANSPVSMNMWGFSPALLGHLDRMWAEFYAANKDEPKTEFLLPTCVATLRDQGLLDVRVVRTTCEWIGVTNPDDLEPARTRLASLRA